MHVRGIAPILDAMSDELPRGAVDLTPDTRALLGRLAKRLGRPLSAAIEPELVLAAEEELGARIPLEVLALLAAEGRLPGDLFALTDGIRAFYAAQDHDLGELAFDHVAVALLSDLDFAGGWGAEPVFAIVRRQDDRAAPPRYARYELRNPTPNGTPYSLAEYLAERHHMVLGAVAGEAFDFALAKAAVNAEVVTHAKFGRGKVTARGEGKVTVAFDDGTTRTLAERFVTPA